MRYLLMLLPVILITSCHSVQKKSEEVALKVTSNVGEAVGKTSSEFVKGVKEGIDLTFDCKLTLSNALIANQVEVGKFAITNGNAGTNNKISVYLIFNKDANMDITAKVFDPKSKEYGRVSVSIQAKKGTAKYVDFVFDQRTDIESRSTIILE